MVGKKKCCNFKNIHFQKRKSFLQFITNFRSFTLEVETSCVIRVFKAILETRIVNDACEDIWLLFLTLSNYLEPEKSVIFELWLCPVDHKTCRGFSEFCSHDPEVSLPIQLSFLQKRFVATSWNKSIILHGDMKCDL